MNRRGITFLEIMVVLGIIVILMALLGQAVLRIRTAKARTQTFNNLMQMSLALHNADSVYKKLPPAAGAYGQITGTAAANPQGTSATKYPTLFFHLIPYLGSDNLYRDASDGTGYLNPRALGPPILLNQTVVPAYVSPQDLTLVNSGAGISNFCANLRVFADNGFAAGSLFKDWSQDPYPKKAVLPYYPKGAPPFYGTACLSQSFPDGTSNTLAFAPAYMVCSDAREPRWFMSPPQTQPSPFFGYYAVSKEAAEKGTAKSGVIFQLQPAMADCDPDFALQSLDYGGLCVSRCDGSVSLLAPGISLATWASLVQPNDGIPPGDDFVP